jgi:hypothetical protein
MPLRHDDPANVFGNAPCTSRINGGVDLQQFHGYANLSGLSNWSN